MSSIIQEIFEMETGGSCGKPGCGCSHCSGHHHAAPSNAAATKSRTAAVFNRAQGPINRKPQALSTGKPSPPSSSRRHGITLLDELFVKPLPTAKPTLRYGSKGIFVVNLQQRLNYHNASIIPLKEDGIWGSKTHSAVLAFQRQKSITVDGVVGPITWGKLDQQASPPKSLPVAQCSVPNANNTEMEFEMEMGWELGWELEINLETPTPVSVRPCCLLGPQPTKGVFLDPTALGTHGSSSEANGVLYTGQAGFIDLGHVRDCCDLTKYIYDQLLISNYATPIKTTHGEAKLKVCPVNALATAKTISYHDSVGYEILTYGMPGPGQHNSAFSPEDLCSNNLGNIIAEKAILSIAAGGTGKTFNGEVTKILNDTLKVLDVQSAAESLKAFNLVNGKWVKHSGLTSMMASDYLRRRNFSHVPWKAGHTSDATTPSWLTDDPMVLSRQYTYTHTTIRTIRDSSFSSEIATVRADAKSKYGSDYDKP